MSGIMILWKPCTCRVETATYLVDAATIRAGMMMALHLAVIVGAYSKDCEKVVENRDEQTSTKNHNCSRRCTCLV
jgi:hypothetical protein